MPTTRCSNEDGRGGRCELAAEHVGYPHRSATWQWDFHDWSNTGPREPEKEGVWWPVYEEVVELQRQAEERERTER